MTCTKSRNGHTAPRHRNFRHDRRTSERLGKATITSFDRSWWRIAAPTTTHSQSGTSCGYPCPAPPRRGYPADRGPPIGAPQRLRQHPGHRSPAACAACALSDREFGALRGTETLAMTVRNPAPLSAPRANRLMETGITRVASLRAGMGDLRGGRPISQRSFIAAGTAVSLQLG
jgi:hypothetical protein